MTSKEALLDIQKRNETLKKEGHFHIGTLTMSVIEELVERDTPMKPISSGNTSSISKHCICNKVVMPCDRFCPKCGQRLDWS